jgi:hypothetical protein
MDTKLWNRIEQDTKPLELLIKLGFPQISQDDISLAKQLVEIQNHLEQGEYTLATQKYTIAQDLLKSNPIAQQYATQYLQTLYERID